MTAVG